MGVVQQTACLVVGPVAVDGFAALFGRAGGSGLGLNDGSGVGLSVKFAGAWCCLWSRPPGFGCLTSVAPASGLAVGYSSCFVSVMNFGCYVHECRSFTRTEQLACVYEPWQNPERD